MADTQREIVEREMAQLSGPRQMQDFIRRKADEFENLRTYYEEQISLAKAELSRTGGDSDDRLMQGIKQGYQDRDREFQQMLATIGHFEVKIVNGLIDLNALRRDIENWLPRK